MKQAAASRWPVVSLLMGITQGRCPWAGMNDALGVCNTGKMRPAGTVRYNVRLILLRYYWKIWDLTAYSVRQRKGAID